MTTRDWSHIWLNEGWATFLPIFYDREKFGQESYDLGRKGVFDGGLAGHHQNPRKTEVWTQYNDPLEMFDDFAYPGGASRMFMLMHRVGEDRFWSGIANYLKENQFKNVTTEIFFDSMSKSLGVDLSEFKKQWFYSPGPLSLTAQKLPEGISLIQGPNRFHVPLDYWLIDPKTGAVDKEKVDLPASGHYELPNSKGKLLMLDPEVWLMADISYDLGYTGADVRKLYDLAPNAAQKARVVDSFFGSLALPEKVSIAREEKSVELLNRLLSQTPDKDLLLDMTRHNDPRVVEAAAKELGAVPDTKVVTDRLTELYSSSPNEVVQEAAFESLLKGPTAVKTAEAGLLKDSFNEGFRTGALRWYAANHPDQARDMCLTALSDPNTTEPVRATSLEILGQVKDLPGKRTVYNMLASFIPERSNGILRAAISALGAYGDKSAIPLLKTRAGHSLVFVRYAVAGAIGELNSK